MFAFITIVCATGIYLYNVNKLASRLLISANVHLHNIVTLLILISASGHIYHRPSTQLFR